MNDNKTTIKQLDDALDEFYKKRDWSKFHKPKDVTIALSIEVSEILEHFRFKTDEEIKVYLNDETNKKEVSHELADTLHFLVLLAHVLKIDLAKSSEEKLKLAAKRYPVPNSIG